MGRVFIIICIVLGIGSIVSAQDKFVHGKMKIDGGVYNIDFIDEYSIIHAANISKNVPYKDVPKLKVKYEPLPILEKDMKVDTARAKSVVLDILKSKLNKLKSNKDYISVDYIFYPSGAVMRIDYILPKHTIITPKDLDKIDKCLRKEIKAHFTGNEYKAFPVIHYNAQKRIYF